MFSPTCINLPILTISGKVPNRIEMFNTVAKSSDMFPVIFNTLFAM